MTIMSLLQSEGHLRLADRRRYLLKSLACCLRNMKQFSVICKQDTPTMQKFNLSVPLRSVLDAGERLSASGPPSKGGKNVTRGRQIEITVRKHPVKGEHLLKIYNLTFWQKWGTLETRYTGGGGGGI